MKSENFNFLEPSGPLQAVNGTALPYTFMTVESHKQEDFSATTNYTVKPHNSYISCNV
jgi:hypothetical protein